MWSISKVIGIAHARVGCVTCCGDASAKNDTETVKLPMQAVFDSTHDLPQRPQTLVKRTEEAKIATSVLPEAEHDVPNGAVDGESE